MGRKRHEDEIIAVGSWYNGRFFSNSFIMLRTGCSEPEKNEQE